MSGSLIPLADRLLLCSTFEWKPNYRILGHARVSYVGPEGLNTFVSPTEHGWISFDEDPRPDLGDEITLDGLEEQLGRLGHSVKPGDCTTRAERLVEAYEDIDLDSPDGLTLPDDWPVQKLPFEEWLPGSWSATSPMPMEPVSLHLITRTGVTLYRAWVGSLDLLPTPLSLPPGSHDLELRKLSTVFLEGRAFQVQVAGGDIVSMAVGARGGSDLWTPADGWASLEGLTGEGGFGGGRFSLDAKRLTRVRDLLKHSLERLAPDKAWADEEATLEWQVYRLVNQVFGAAGKVSLERERQEREAQSRGQALHNLHALLQVLRASDGESSPVTFPQEPVSLLPVSAELFERGVALKQANREKASVIYKISDLIQEAE